jgi:hypothetical protein
MLYPVRLILELLSECEGVSLDHEPSLPAIPEPMWALAIAGPPSLVMPWLPVVPW